MADGTKNRYRGDLARLTALAAGALALFAIILLAVIVYAGWSSNQAAFESERTLIENSLNQTIERSLDEQKSVAWWDAAVLKVNERGVDYNFADTEFGVFLTKVYEQDEIYLINSRGEALYGYLDGARVSPLLFERYRRALGPMLAELWDRTPSSFRKRPAVFGQAEKFHRVLVPYTESARWAGHIISLNGRPAIVSAITIVPNVDMSLQHGPPIALLSVTFITPPFIGDIGRALLLNDLELAPASQHKRGTVSVPFVTDEGVRVGDLTWTSKRPGRVLLNLILPLVGVALAAAGGVFANMLIGLKRATANLAQSESQARHEALHDNLSGLPNRSHFLLKLDRELAVPGLKRKVLAAYIDVDRFKDINDTMGHHAGDVLIKAVAERLRTYAHPDDFLARFGGDEFAVLSSATEDGACEQALAQRIAQSFAAPFLIAGQDICVTASIGIAAAPDHGRNADELLQHADIALYEAKAQGRDRAVLFASSMGDKIAQRRLVEVDLRAAIESNELALHFQPIISARANRICGAEALLRWNHPKFGMIPPATFIPVAEEAGLMPALGEWVLRRAMQAAARWPQLEISVNLSPVQFRHTDLRAQLSGLVSSYNVDPRNIVLEITEGVLLESDPRTKAVLDALRDMGFKLALDDFGTGYSSLAYLCEFRFDKIKIDRTFVTGFARGDVPRSVLSAVVSLGAGLGMDVVAEGVETEFDVLAMRHLGCNELQGYYFSPAVEPGALDALLAKETAIRAPQARAQ